MQRTAEQVLGALTVLLLAFLLMLAIMTSGCVPKGYVKAEAIKPSIDLIRGRHDTYVEKDPDLTEVEKRTYLRTGEILDKVLQEAQDQAADDQAYLDALDEKSRALEGVSEYDREEHETYCCLPR